MSTMTVGSDAECKPAGPVRRIASHVCRVWRALAREYRIRQTLRILNGLDDRMLRDIGVHRGDLEQSVRRGCCPGWPRRG